MSETDQVVALRVRIERWLELVARLFWFCTRWIWAWMIVAFIHSLLTPSPFPTESIIIASLLLLLVWHVGDVWNTFCEYKGQQKATYLALLHIAQQHGVSEAEIKADAARRGWMVPDV